MNAEEYNKKSKEPVDFLDLAGDSELRIQVAALAFEDESDKNQVKNILKQKSLSKAQREWFKILVKRNGLRFESEFSISLRQTIAKAINLRDKKGSEAC